jgi:hypothetical protein
MGKTELRLRLRLRKERTYTEVHRVTQSYTEKIRKRKPPIWGGWGVEIKGRIRLID